MDTNESQFKVSKVTPAYWRLTFNNPPINMLDPQTILELQDLVSEFEADPQLKVVVFDSADPDFFVAHFDASRAAATPTAPSPTGYSPWIDLTVRLARVPVISIAAVRGRARGVGSEFALACDLRFASLEKAVFAQIEVGVGVIPGGGALERLPLLVGRARALEIVVSATDFDAATAERYGWINRAIPDAQFETWVDAFARRIASFDRDALAAAKQQVNRHTLPEPKDQEESRQLFFSGLGGRGYQDRAPKLRSNGIGKPGDFELRLGELLGNLVSDSDSNAGG